MRIESDDSDDEDGSTVFIYDTTCNTTMNRRGYLRSCKTSMTSEILAREGWQRATTTGRNSYIFRRRNWVLKIVKHYTARNAYCRSVDGAARQIRLLCDNMGSLAPRVKHIRVCNWNDDPALTLLMRDEGETHVSLPSVTDAHIRSTVQRLIHCGIMSSDIITETGTVNTGNLAFRLTSPGRRLLIVRFLDVDVPSNFMNTTNVPQNLLERVWYTVVCVCLRRPVEPLSYADLDALTSTWTSLFQ